MTCFHQCLHSFALHLAAENGHSEIVQVLLEAHADADKDPAIYRMEQVFCSLHVAALHACVLSFHGQSFVNLFRNILLCNSY